MPAFSDTGQECVPGGQIQQRADGPDGLLGAPLEVSRRGRAHLRVRAGGQRRAGQGHLGAVLHAEWQQGVLVHRQQTPRLRRRPNEPAQLSRWRHHMNPPPKNGKKNVIHKLRVSKRIGSLVHF